MALCFGWRSNPFWCCFDGFVSGVCASLSLPCPVRLDGGCDRACLLLDGRRRCSSACGAGCRVLATWGPLLVPCSLCSPACEILSFFLGIFRGGSSGISSSHCWLLLNWRHLSVFRPASVGDRSPLWPLGWRPQSSAVADGSCTGMGGRLSSLLRERRVAATLVPMMPCASAGISFRPILACSRLNLAWWIRRACAGLLLPRRLGACRRPLRLFHRLISPRYGCVKLTESSLAIFLEVMTGHGFLPVPGHRHWRPCRAFPPFLGHSPFHRL